MNLQQLITKLKAYPLALSLFGVAILLAGWAYWRSSGTLQDDYDQLDQVKKDSELYNKNVTSGEKIDEHLGELTADGNKFKAALINYGDVVLNQQYFRDIAEKAGVQVVDPTQGTMAERGKDPAEPSLITFNLSASGRWSNMVAFIYGLQTGDRLLRFNLFRLEKTKVQLGTTGDSDLLVVTLNVEVLGQ